MSENCLRRIVFESTPITLAIGDVVWFYFDGLTQNHPAPAMVLEFGEDNMLTVELHTLAQPGRQRVATGVCMLGDPRLDNANFRKRGVWAPRGSWMFNNGPPKVT